MVPIPFTLIPTDSVRSDGHHIYKLKLSAPATAKTEAVIFSITTNHPEKKDIIVSGVLKK
jgi:hypothetical protein